MPDLDPFADWPDLVTFVDGAGRGRQGPRSARCPGQNAPAHTHDMRCIARRHLTVREVEPAELEVLPSYSDPEIRADALRAAVDLISAGFFGPEEVTVRDAEQIVIGTAGRFADWIRTGDDAAWRPREIGGSMPDGKVTYAPHGCCGPDNDTANCECGCHPAQKDSR